jgi:hypothetical protein
MFVEHSNWDTVTMYFQLGFEPSKANYLGVDSKFEWASTMLFCNQFLFRTFSLLELTSFDSML